MEQQSSINNNTFKLLLNKTLERSEAADITRLFLAFTLERMCVVIMRLVRRRAGNSSDSGTKNSIWFWIKSKGLRDRSDRLQSSNVYNSIGDDILIHKIVT